MNGYSEVPTRPRREGVADKLALVEAMADKYAVDRPFAERVLQVVRHADNGADQQVSAWCQFVENLPYRREPHEVFRCPTETVKVGGDCDDLVITLLAGLRSLSIPARAEILSSPEGWAFHIRARVGLPPLHPVAWLVVDPVWRSERQWAMIDRPVASKWWTLSSRVLVGAGQRPSPRTVGLLWAALAAAVGGYLWCRWR